MRLSVSKGRKLAITGIAGLVVALVLLQRKLVLWLDDDIIASVLMAMTAIPVITFIYPTFRHLWHVDHRRHRS